MRSNTGYVWLFILVATMAINLAAYLQTMCPDLFSTAEKSAENPMKNRKWNECEIEEYE